MQVQSERIGLPEYLLAAVLLTVAALVVLAVNSGWGILIVPGTTYGVAAVGTYAIYRLASPRAVRVVQPAFTDRRAQAAVAASFRVVETRGICPLGRRAGDLVSIGPAGEITPELCSHAEAVLRVASANGGEEEVEEWCCPVYDHLLVFHREALAV
jgi:hypothetical protein